MKMSKHSLRKIVTFLNDPDEDGGFWLPNIQRAFVWTEEQTCRLFDSILREYPISTLLIWKTRSTLRRRKFIDNFREEHRYRLSDFFVPQNQNKKCLVLDGQQRLQSLFIGLKGSYEGRELFLHILSGEISAPDDVKYKFAFMDAKTASFPWIKFKDLVFSDEDPLTTAEQIIANSPTVTQDERKKISRHVGIIFKTFQGDDGISYQELDSTENPTLYTEDDVVEIFIRANSGGTKLNKSDLLFALLASSWDEANDEMEEVLEDLNRGDFAFTRDFVLKTCLTLLDRGARYEVEKFRNTSVREEMKSEWTNITDAIKDVLDYVRGKTFVRCDKALPSYLVLIPLIYLRYHFKEAWREAVDRDTYLIRTLLSGAFSGTPDQLIDNLVAELRRSHSFDSREIFGVIRSANRSLELTEDRFWQIGHGSDGIHLLFNLWYRDFNYTPAYKNNLPQVDHIFPQSLLRKAKKRNPSTARMDLMRYPDRERNQLANCMLLTQEENGAGGKSDIPPDKWFVGARGEEAYLNMHLIPRDPALWKIDRFDEFIEERKRLITERFKSLLVSPDHRSAVSLDDIARLLDDKTKNMSKLIDSRLLLENAPLVLKYQGHVFSGTVHRNGIQLMDGDVYSPSAAAIRCYETVGSVRPTENGWKVWKTVEGMTLGALYEKLQLSKAN